MTVTVAIPAHNEEKNIGQLLHALLSQEQDDFRISEIVVISDGSTDGTAEVVRSLRHPSVRVIQGAGRLGKIVRMNEMFASSPADVLVMFDADVRLEHSRVIAHLVRPFLEDGAVGLVGGYDVPLDARTFVEQCANFGVRAWSAAVDSLEHNPKYRCASGRVRAFSRAFYKDLRVPPEIGSGEDTYCFYRATADRHRVVFAPRAVVRFRSPSTAADYLKQMRRFLREHEMIVREFGTAFVARYETLDVTTRLRAFFREAAQTPAHVVLGFAVLQLLAHALPGFRPSKTGTWEISTSTKNV